MHPNVELLCTFACSNAARVIPNARFPHLSSPTYASSYAILHSTATPSDPLVAFRLLTLGSTIDVDLGASHSARSWLWRWTLILLATSSRFGEIPGGNGGAQLLEVPLHDRGIDPSWSSPHGQRRIGQLLLSLREPRRRHIDGLFRLWLIGNNCDNKHGASEDRVPKCFVEPEHHRRRRSALPGLAMPPLRWPEAQATPGSLHMQQPVSNLPCGLALLAMATRSSHSADAKPACPSRFDAGA
jgi:hypothetical protein